MPVIISGILTAGMNPRCMCNESLQEEYAELRAAEVISRWPLTPGDVLDVAIGAHELVAHMESSIAIAFRKELFCRLMDRHAGEDARYKVMPESRLPLRAYMNALKSILAAVCVAVVLTSTAIAGDPVRVILHMPPPTQLRVEQLWRISLVNTTQSKIRLKLYGVAHDGTGRWIANGTSSAFDIPPGIMNVGPSDIGPIDYHADAEYDAVVTRTGTVPAGIYTICMYALDAVTSDTLGRDCSSAHVVLNVTPPHLINPRSNEILRDVPPVFSWTPVAPMVSLIEVSYRLNVVEVLGRQSPYDAIQSNPSWFSEDNLANTLVQYPLSAETFEPGATYAWQVTAFARDMNGAEGELAKSEIRAFSLVVQDTAGRPITNKAPDNICGTTAAKLTSAGKDRSYKLTITYNDSVPRPERVQSILVKCHKDTVLSIEGGVPKGWERTPSKFPPGSSAVTWTSTSGAIPAGTTELGVLTFAGTSSAPVTVVFEWLNKGNDVMCKDSTILNERLTYYELTDEESDALLEVPNTVLHIEYMNPYASMSDGQISIVDASSHTRMKSNATRPPVIQNLNGLNRIAVPLPDYKLLPGKSYTFRVACAKSTFVMNFKIKTDKATNDREK
jgi:hypothetical protein